MPSGTEAPPCVWRCPQSPVHERPVGGARVPFRTCLSSPRPRSGPPPRPASGPPPGRPPGGATGACPRPPRDRVRSTDLGGPCTTSGSRSLTGATSDASTACRRKCSGATMPSCRGSSSFPSRRSRAWLACSSASASGSSASPAANRSCGGTCPRSSRCSRISVPRMAMSPSI